MANSLSDCIREKVNAGRFFYSIEIFPPKTEADLSDLYGDLEAFLRDHQPLFCDITYHIHSQRPAEHPCSSLSIASNYSIIDYST